MRSTEGRRLRPRLPSSKKNASPPKAPSAVGTFARHVRRNAVAYLAPFFALGGTAYAAATVGSSQVIDNSLLSRGLKDNAAVLGRDVVNDGLSLALGGLAGRE